MITMKSDKSMRLLTAFLALGILVSGWGLLALESQHKADRAVSNRQAAQIAQNEETINALANALAVSNANFSETLAQNQKEIALNKKQIAILKRQVISLGGRPIIVVSKAWDSGPSSQDTSSKKKSSQTKPSPSPRPSPSPTCPGPSIGSICLP